MKRTVDVPDRSLPSPNAARGLNAVFCWVVLGIVLFLAVFIRLRLLDLPFERDEGEFATMGRMILDGIPPYREAYNLKPPGIYLAYAFVMMLFGESSSGVHIGLLIVNLLCAFLLFFIVRTLRGRSAAALSTAAFLALSSMPKVLGLSAHATHFVLLPALGGILLMVRHPGIGIGGTDSAPGEVSVPGANGKRVHFALLLAGFLMGVSFLMKQPGIYFILFGAVWIVWAGWSGRGRKGVSDQAVAARMWSTILWYLLGVAVPIVLTLTWLWNAGVFDRFWFWVVTYALRYGSEVGFVEGLDIAWSVGSSILLPSLAVSALAVVGLITIGKNSSSRDETLFILAFLVASALAVAMGFHFRRHYFVLLLPVVAILFGIGLQRVSELFFRNLRTRRFAASVPVIAGSLAIAQIGFSGSAVYFSPEVNEASRIMFGANPFVESPMIGERVRQMTADGDRIAVVGSEPQIYFYSGRLPATGYLYTYSLVENQPHAGSMRNEMTAEIERSRPAVLVYVNSPSSWMLRPGSDLSIFSWFRQYREREGYSLAGVVEIMSPARTISVWGAEVEAYRRTTENYIEIWRR